MKIDLEDVNQTFDIKMFEGKNIDNIKIVLNTLNDLIYKSYVHYTLIEYIKSQEFSYMMMNLNEVDSIYFRYQGFCDTYNMKALTKRFFIKQMYYIGYEIKTSRKKNELGEQERYRYFRYMGDENDKLNILMED